MIEPVLPSIRVWTLPKPDAESHRENEDRFAIAGFRPGQFLQAPLTIAVSDGASDGLFAREWARALARAAATTPEGVQGPETLAATVQQAAERWRAQTGTTELPWFLEARRNRPTGATLLRLTVYPEGRWEALAVGDTCLVPVRQGEPGSVFPLARADDFSAAPDLLLVQAFHSEIVVRVPEEVRVLQGEWHAGDSFFLLTDALAHWFLRETEGGRTPSRWLEGIHSAAGFRDRVDILRENGRLRGDDTTMIYFRLDAAEGELGLADSD